jgi:hypothetical protein
MKSARLHKNAETSDTSSLDSNQEVNYLVKQFSVTSPSTFERQNWPKKQCLVPISNSDWRRWANSNWVRKAITIGPNVTVQDLAEIELWLESIESIQSCTVLTSHEFAGHKS